MKQLNDDTIKLLKNLISEIDFEESKEEGDDDLVVENLYKVIDIIRPIVEE